MTQEQTIKLEQATKSHLIDLHGHTLDAAREDGFKAGAQTILDNPQDWGLTEPQDISHLSPADIWFVNNLKCLISLSVSKVKKGIGKSIDRYMLADWTGKNSDRQDQLSRYREALELIAMPKADRGDVELIAKEALKEEQK